MKIIKKLFISDYYVEIFKYFKNIKEQIRINKIINKKY